jgi:hypothetical protein
VADRADLLAAGADARPADPLQHDAHRGIVALRGPRPDGRGG